MVRESGAFGSDAGVGDDAWAASASSPSYHCGANLQD
jgi:hypothetical protein